MMFDARNTFGPLAPGTYLLYFGHFGLCGVKRVREDLGDSLKAEDAKNWVKIGFSSVGEALYIAGTSHEDLQVFSIRHPT